MAPHFASSPRDSSRSKPLRCPLPPSPLPTAALSAVFRCSLPLRSGLRGRLLPLTNLLSPTSPSRSQRDVRNLRDHIANGYGRRPPDHLVFEWFAGESAETKAYAQGRTFRIFRYNVFHHIGHISTLAQPKNRFAPGCYSLLYDWVTCNRHVTAT